VSAKAIRDLILLTRPWREEVAKRALAEVEAAIERAAPVALAAFTGDIHVFKPGRLDHCYATLESIAKEVPNGRGFDAPPVIKEACGEPVHGRDLQGTSLEFRSTPPDEKEPT